MKCRCCAEFEATFILERGKLIFDEFHILETYYLCEMCLLDYESSFKNIGLPYRIKVIPEKVSFT